MNTRLYRCYSANLKKFLYDNGVIYDMVCKDIKTDKTCWVYIKGEKLSEYLTKWTENRPSK